MLAWAKPSPLCACYNRRDRRRPSFLRTIARLFHRFLHCELKIAPGGAKRIRRKNDDLSRAEASGCSVHMTIRGTNDAEKNAGGGVERRLIGPGSGGGRRSPQCADHSGGRHGLLRHQPVRRRDTDPQPAGAGRAGRAHEPVLHLADVGAGAVDVDDRQHQPAGRHGRHVVV
ncbi:Uncharacterised protein [Serratia marcescens]|uniref:Uncharacterized protein n=1 Tax=Serratia marcescens TaxID=615 RepID=A0A379Y1L2_SERMA|nr:Uncharacterised protein [Serratia marcescens]